MSFMEENIKADIGVEVEEKINYDGSFETLNDVKQSSRLSIMLTQTAAFSYDRAKELVEEELELFKSLHIDKIVDANHAAIPSQEITFHLNVLKLLANICVYEKSYGNLVFLSGAKSIFRKENTVKAAYHGLYNELCKISALENFKTKETSRIRLVSPLLEPSETFTVYNEGDQMSPKKIEKDNQIPKHKSTGSIQATPRNLIKDLICFVSIRLELMEFYDQLCGLGETNLSMQRSPINPNLISVSSFEDSKLLEMEGTIISSSDKQHKHTVSSPTNEFNLKRNLSVDNKYENIDIFPYVTSSWNLGNMKNNSIFMPYRTVLMPILEKIQIQYGSQLATSCLQNLSDAVRWEVGILNGLIKALQFLDDINYYECLINLNRANSYLTLWENFSRTKWEEAVTNNRHQKLSDASPLPGRGIFESLWHRKTNTPASLDKSNKCENMESSVGSALFRWLVKLKDVALSKFSFLFYEELSRQINSPSRMRFQYDENISKLRNGINFMNKLEIFQRKLLCKEKNPKLSTFFFLICEANLDSTQKTVVGVAPQNIAKSDYQPPMKHQLLFTSSCFLSHENTVIENRKKEKSFQSSISLDIGTTPSEKIREVHLPIISAQLQENMTWSHLSRPNQVIHFDCVSRQAKYFLLRVEPLTVLAFIISFTNDPGLNSMQLNNSSLSSFPVNCIDLQEVSHFMHEIAHDTRCNYVFASLKSIP